MRYFIVLFFLSFLTINKVNAFLPSESNSESNYEVSSESENKQKNSVKNPQTKNQEQSKKEVRKNKKEFKKAFRKAIFEKWKNHAFHKKDSSKKVITDAQKPSIISIIALISGLVFFGILLAAIALGSIGEIMSLAVVAALVGLITGIIGLFTNNKEKHNTRKTNLYSIVGIASGVVMIAIFALVIFALTVAWG